MDTATRAKMASPKSNTSKPSIWNQDNDLSGIIGTLTGTEKFHPAAISVPREFP
jgi:hypothetical protein